MGIEAREQFLEMTGELPDSVVACVGGGSNAMGMFSAFLDDEECKLYGIEPAGRSLNLSVMRLHHVLWNARHHPWF